MAHTITWPGLPGGPITFSFPVSTEFLVPQWRTLQRPGIKARKPRRAVQHTNGNSNARARQDTIYLHNGAGGRQASWHGTVDHAEGCVNLPADEIGWHASDGAGPGNYNGFAVELSEWPWIHGTPAQWRQARKNAAEMMGRVSARIDAADPDYHNDYAPDNKWCPRPILNNPTWMREYEEDWWSFYNDEKARMSGTTPEDAYTKGDHLEVIADAVNVRTGYGTAYRIVGTLRKGQALQVIADTAGDTTQYANGYQWVNIRSEGFGTGWMATGFGGEAWIRTVDAPAPKPEPEKPTYADPAPVAELLETNMTFEDMYNTSAGVTTINELDFIFVADVIEFKRTSPALQYGYEGAPEVKAPYQEGDRAIAAWLVKGNDGLYYYLLTGGDDEWVRVRFVDTVRVSDAPLLGDSMH